MVTEQYAEYAGFWLRLGAYLVDAIILWIISLIITTIGTGVATAIAGGVITIVYFIGFWSWRGQTPGMIFFGIKIVRCDGSEIRWRRAIPRFLGFIIPDVVSFIILFLILYVWITNPGTNIIAYLSSTIPIVISIGYFSWIAFDKKKQGLHDKIAGTYVIRLPRARW